METLVKHLEFIQGIVNRLAANSFQLKGWSVFIVAAILSIGALEKTEGITLLAVLPVIVFWGLDGYYLWQERLFRLLYDFVRVQTPAVEADFSMNPTPVKDKDKGWWSATFSVTVLLFHGSLLAAVVAVNIILYCQTS